MRSHPFFTEQHQRGSRQPIARLCMLLIVLCALTACQQTDEPIPSAAPTLTPTPRAALFVATTPPRRTVTDPTAPPTVSIAPTSLASSAPAGTLVSPLAGLTPARDLSGITGEAIGASVEGRAIEVFRFGEGAQRLVLVGGLHGGYEANTVVLMRRMIVHFQNNPDAIPSGAAVWIIPAANPDGLAMGGGERGRFNGRGVDLNRNWGCDWSPGAYWRETVVNPGLNAFSEPETQAIADLIRAARPRAALFYHSATNGVFPGNCRGDHGSAGMGALYAQAAGYPCCAGFTAYPVTGTAAEWADGEGIPAADVELSSRESPEFERNLSGVLALLAWLAGG